MNYYQNNFESNFRNEVGFIFKSKGRKPTEIEEMVKYKKSDEKELIYHYTNYSTFEKIIKNNEIWATNLAYMNDSKELVDGFNLISKKINQKINTYRKSDKSGGSFLTDFSPGNYNFTIESNDFKFCLWKKIDDYLNLVSQSINLKNDDDPIHVYASCFTRNGDQLSQWRGYGNDGFSIGFNPNKLESTITLKSNIESEREENFNKNDIRLLSVRYSDNYKIELLSNLIEAMQENFDEIQNNESIKTLINNRKKDVDNQLNLKNIIITIMMQSAIGYYYRALHALLSVCKDKGFEEEEEVRLVYYARENFMNYINIKNAYTPYVIFKPQNNQKFPVEEIIISPDYANKIHQVKAGIKLLLKSSGYTDEEIANININKSKIPFRK